METKYWNFQVELPPLQVWPQKMREGQVGQPYGSLLVNAQGLSSGPFTYEIRGLPTGLVARDNVISGVPAAAGSFNVAIKVTDANNYTATIRKTITVKSQPTITVDYRGGSSVPDARYGESYSAQFDAGGGTPQYVYSVANGVLPDGLSLDSATGKITGVAEKAGEFRFDMVATDKDGYSGKRSTLINVPQPEIVINPTDLPAGKVGLTYEATQLVAEGGLAPYTYKKSAHTSPPPGLAVNATTGVLSGKPTTAGTYSFWLGATDKHGYGGVESGTYGWRYYTVTIEEAPTISVDVANLADGKQNLDYGTHTVTASGGAAPYTYAIEGLPAGLKADGNTVSGTPTVAGSFPITINVKDQDGYEKPFTKTLEIKKAPTITVSHRGSSSVPDTTYAKNYSEQFDADGGTSPYVFSVANGVLPDGLSLDSATGEITGVAKKPGDFRFDLVATDKEGYSGKRNTLISVSKPTIIVSPTTLPAGKERLAYGSHQISASGGIEPYTYEIKGLPAGLTGEGDTISGTPTEAGSFDITINVKDSNGYEQPVTKTLEIKSAPTITIDTTDLAAGKQNLDYGSHTVTASGGAAPYTYAIEGLPAGLKADGNTISGTPTEAGSFSITINVKDHDGYEQPFTKTLEVEPAPTIVVDAEGFHRAYKNVDYVPITVTASGGTPPYSYEFTGLPQGLTGDKNTGTVSGRTSYVGSVLVYIKVTDAKGYTSPATAKFGVWNVPTLADIPDGKQNLDYGTYTITATGGPGGYSYQIENLPEGLTARGNVISGTPAVAGSFDVPVKVTDKEGNTLTFNKAIAISPAPTISIDVTDLPAGKQNLDYGTHTVTASGGAAPYTYAIEGLPARLKADGNTISGTPTEAGSFPITINVKDHDGYEQPFTKTLEVNKAPTITIDTTDLSVGNQNLDYGSHTVAASGGAAPYTYAIKGLPAGLKADGNTVSGTPTEAGSFSITINVKDHDGYEQPFTKTLEVKKAPTITIDTTDLTAGKQNLDYGSHTVAASGGAAPYTYAIKGLPAGLKADGNTISGTPTEVGSFSITINVKDHDGYEQPFTKTLEVKSAPTITIDTSDLTAGKQNLDYGSHTVTASGGAAPYTYAIEGLPAGLKADGNTISGTPTEAGSFSITINVRDHDGYEQPFTKTLEVNKAPTITIDTTDLPAGKQNLDYGSHTVTASGGAAPYTYAIEGLPAGLKADGNTVSGTPTEAGSFPITINVKDQDGYEKPFTKTLEIKKAPTITVSHRGSSSVPDTTYAKNYSEQFDADGGTSPYVFSVANGVLPDGLSLDSATGEITGVAKKPGDFRFDLVATDKEGYSGKRNTLISVSKPTIIVSPTTLPAGKERLAYGSHQISASGGIEPYTYEIKGLPAGLTGEGDTISGAPTEAGSFDITINVKDSNGYEQPVTKTLEIKSAPTITIDTTDLAAGKQNLDYGSHTVTASGGAAPYTYGIAGLPAGLKADGNTISGTPTEAGSFSITINVKDHDGYEQPFTKTLEVNKAPTITIDTTDLPAGKQNLDYGSHTVTASGGAAPYTYEIEGLPAGLKADGNTISGTPTEAGSFSITINVRDHDGYEQPFTKTLEIKSAPTITIDTTDLTAGKQNLDYGSHTVAASGGAAPYTYAIEGLPAGLKADGNTVSGTPTEAGSFSITINVKDHDGYEQPFTKTLEITKAPTITIDTTDLAAGKQNLDYGSHTVTASGGAAPYTYGIAGLPAGLKADGNTISGTPTEAGSFDITINVKDSNGYEQPFTKTLEIKSAPTITIDTTDLPAGKQNLDYGSHTVTASGGAAPYTYEIEGLPAGLKADGNTVSGTPTVAGSFSITINVKDHDGYERPFTKTLEIKSAPTITIDTTDLPAGKQNLDYGSHTVTASGGAAPYTYAIEGLPAGLKADGNTISGTPTEAGSFSITINVKDHDGYEQPFTKTLEITKAPTITIDTTDLSVGNQNLDYGSHTVTASGGAAPYTYEIKGLPAGLTGEGDTISGTPTEAGSFDITINVKDSNGYEQPVTKTLEIKSAPTITIDTTDLPTGNQNLDYGTHTVAASGGAAPYAYEIKGLPAGLKADGNTISGTPTEAGSFSITINVKDHDGYEQPFTKTLEIKSAPTITIDTTDLPAGKQNLDYGSHTVAASGGAAPYTYEIEGLPAGLKADGNTVSGTPTEAGSFSITINVKDHDGYEQPFTKTLEIKSAPTITIDTTDLTAGKQNLDYGSHTVAASGGAAPYTYEIEGLPAGLKADGNTISGTPTKADTYEVTITVTDHEKYKETVQKTLVIEQAPKIKVSYRGGPAIPDTSYGAEYRVQLEASGGTAPYVYSVSKGALPDGLSLERTNGKIKGIPKKTGDFRSIIVATDAQGFSGERSVRILVSPPEIAIDTSTIPTKGEVGLDYGSHTVIASGGAEPYKYEITGLPEGMSAKGNMISGTPAKAGSFTVTILATDSNGYPAKARQKLEIARARIEAKDHALSVMAGATGTVDLLDGAVGKPITAAAIVSAPDAATGQARIVQVGNSYTLYFSTSPFFAGSTNLKYTLSNAQGSSAPAKVSITVIPRPDPSKDPEVIGLATAQVETTNRMTRMQIRNFQHRLELLHEQPECRKNDIGFNLGLDGANLHPKWFDGKPGCAASARAFSVWTSGELNMGRSGNHRDRRIQHSSVGISSGVDFRFSPSLIGGAGLGYGKDVSDAGTKGTQSRATMLSIAAYGSYHPGKNIFLDGVAGYGWLNFDNMRYVTATGDMAKGNRQGRQVFGAVSVGYDYRNESVLLSPYIRSDAAHATLSGFTENGGGLYNLTYGAQNVDMLSATLGLRGEYAIPIKWGTLKPRGRLEYTHDFSAAGKAKMGYSDMGGVLPYAIDTKANSRTSLRIEAGVDAELKGGWKLGLDYGTQLNKDQGARQHNVNFKLSKEF